jgi:signal transduction histidine kinase/CheY-like chemotaxis protein
VDYARRYAAQRRLAGASCILIWILFAGRDWWLLRALDPSILLYVGYARLGGAAGMALPVWLIWGPRGLDESSAVKCMCVGTLSAWWSLSALMALYPAAMAFREIVPGFLLVLFMIFTSFRLRAVTAAWLVGLCVVIFNLVEFWLYLWQPYKVPTLAVDWISRGTMVSLMYVAGVIVCIEFERAARREFLFRRSIRSAKARVEAQNKQMKELVKEKQRFFSSAYHDIQQPLAAINLFIRSARMKLEDEHAASHDLKVIEETARDILDMFKDIQDYSELGSYVPRIGPVNTMTVLAEVYEQYIEPARSRGIEFRVSVRRRLPPPIESDRPLFKRVLSNFVSNAIKNTSEGGLVVGWVKIGDRLRVDVWDTGVGISSMHRDAIFAEYYQIDNPGRDRSKGLGLGLSIVHRIISILPRHSMSFWSVAARGSRFSLYVPISRTTPLVDEDHQTSSGLTSVLKSRYVMLCDDDPTVLEGLRRLFLSAGALVDCADSMAGFNAILADDGRVPDVIVTDIRLRDGSTGIEVAQQIRRHFAWAGVLPVVFITGELLSPGALRDFAAPFVLLRKSSAPEDTLTEIGRFIADHPPPDFGRRRDL